MVVLKAKNPNLNSFEHTEVATAIAAAGTTLVVDNTQGFVANDYVVVGNEGSDLRESVQITSITNDTTMVVGAVKFAHSIDEPVYKTIYNQIVFQSGSSESGDFFNRSTNSIEWDSPDGFTTLNYPSGSVNDWYRYVFRNSYTSTESQYSKAVQVPSYYCTVADVADYLNLEVGADTEIPFRDVIKALRFASREVDNLTNTSFKSNSVTLEYHDGQLSTNHVYFTNRKPILAVSTLQTTSSDESVGTDDATWTTLEENDDFTVDKENGVITIADETKLPEIGDNRLRVSYTWGHSSVPEDVRLLTTLVVVRYLMKSSSVRSVVMGRSGVSSPNTNVIDEQIGRIAGRYTFGGIENT